MTKKPAPPDELVRPQYVKIQATMLLIHENIRQPRRDPGPWRRPIPLRAEEFRSLALLRVLVRAGVVAPSTTS
jgi:hypothetical protein